MATPTADTYTAPSGTTALRVGRAAPPPPPPAPPPPAPAPGAPWTAVFSGVTSDGLGGNSSAGLPQSGTDQVLELNLHGSGGRNTILTAGTLYTGTCVTAEVWQANNTFRWAASNGGSTQLAPGGSSKAVYRISPQDKVIGMPNDGAGEGETYWMGLVNAPSAALSLYTERRLDAMLRWARENVSAISLTRWVCTGSSMGAWGGWTYALRRPQWFGAVYGNAPRWRYHGTSGLKVWLTNWLQTFGPTAYDVSSAPALSTQDGGGSSATHVDLIAYVTNPANPMPWVGWSIGRNDGYGPWSDQVAAIAALRATKRGFAVTWNDGTHGSNPNLEAVIKSSYPSGLFEVGKGYPLFTNHSLDANPATDLVGGINVGLTWRNVVETSSGWSCEVTSLVSACTVAVEPKSTVFTASVTPQTITIPAAASWVPVSFTA